MYIQDKLKMCKFPKFKDVCAKIYAKFVQSGSFSKCFQKVLKCWNPMTGSRSNINLVYFAGLRQ